MITDKQVCKILGWLPCPVKDFVGTEIKYKYPEVTTDPALAVQAIEELEQIPGCSSFCTHRTFGKWYVQWGKIDYVPTVEQEDASFPMAVCKAIVAAFEEEAKHD